MFGVPIMVILYFFFIAVSPFTLRIAAKLATFLRLWLVVLWTRKKQDVFFLSCGKPIRFRSEYFYMREHKSSHRKGKKYSEDYKDTKIFPIFFYCFLAVFAKIGLFGFRRKTKKLKGVNNQNEKSNYLCPLFQR